MRVLAIHGGPPAFPSGPPAWPLVEDTPPALADGSWGRYEGRHSSDLIAALAQVHGTPWVYPCCSGSFAVELALRSLRIAPGDEVILAGYDFPGNFRAIEAVGAMPVLVDIVPARWHLDIDQLKAAASPQTKAILVSHLHGSLAPMREICELAKSSGWQVVEDACQATGAIVNGKPAGTWGDVGVLSFGGSKLLTSGRGGAILTHDEQIYQRARVFCEPGNHAYPLSEMQAAALVPQVGKLAERNARRAAAVETLVRHIDPHFQWAEVSNGEDQSAFYKLGLLLSDVGGPDAIEQRRARFIAALQSEGIGIDSGFRGFAKRSLARCRRVGKLHHSQHAAVATLVLHHPVLLEPLDLIERLGEVICEVAKSVMPEH